MTDAQHTRDRLGAATYPPPSGDFVSSLQQAVVENPISAALIGMGVLWLFVGGGNTTLFGGGGRKSIFRTASSYTEEAGSAVNDVGSSLRRVAASSADTASQAIGAAGQVSSALGDAASRTSEQVADTLSSAYEMATGIASRSTASAADTIARTLQKKGGTLGTAVQQNVSGLLERQPLLLGAAGLAIGAAIAASIRTTEAEKRTFGKASDLVRDTVREQAAKVKEIAGAALTEVEAQGLAPSAAGETLRSLGEKMTQAVKGAQQERKR
jgi:hypothetical protein